MKVAVTNDVKIYNLSAGKSLPEWISAAQRRKAQKSDINIEKRIELIEDFEMPDGSDCIGISKDGNYLLATGTYLPRIRCYELNNMALKFERCTYADNISFNFLSDDYSKIILLQTDRYVEIHNQGGKWYRFRVPKVCRDMVYHTTSCDQYFVGSSSQIYRFNLEQGRFLTPLESAAPAFNSIQINPEHQMICVGSTHGKVEGWDARSRTRAAVLDCGLQAITPGNQVTSVPAVTSLSFRDGLNLAVGTSTGLVLMYDIRSNKPMLTKDHMYGLPIKKVLYHTGYDNDFVLSMDSQIVKIWDRESGKSYTSIEATRDFTDLCLYQQSGILFMSSNQKKMQTYYIPSLGPAPRWASVLDSLTEELEESTTATVYDDYKFVTREDLQLLGMEHLIGSQLMRAHMHGFYMDIRLYRKACEAQDPNRVEAIKKQYVASEIDKMREKRVKIELDLPAVNADLFSRLKEETTSNVKAKAKVQEDILKDDRFSSLFTDKNFQVDPNDEDYTRLFNAKRTKAKAEAVSAAAAREDEDSTDEEEAVEAVHSEDEDLASSEDEDKKVVAKREARAKAKERREYKENTSARLDEEAKARYKAKQLFLKEKLMRNSNTANNEHKLSELQNDAMETKSGKRKSKQSLEERIGAETGEEVHANTGAAQITFHVDDKPYAVKKREEKNERHLQERREVRRSTKKLKTDKIGPNFWTKKK